MSITTNKVNKMSCNIPCKLESMKQHAESLGSVQGEELICRGGFEMHFRNSKLKRSIIKSSDLENGSLSFWRAGKSVGDEKFNIAVEKIYKNRPMKNGQVQELICVCYIKTLELREISFPEIGRVLCIIDDCSTDSGGTSFDLAHCVVKKCEKVSNFKMGDRIFEDTVNLLYKKLKNNMFKYE